MAFELSTERQDDDGSVKMSHSNTKMIVKKDCRMFIRPNK